jgi:hypothetical protein
MLFNVIFNNSSAISLRLVLLVEEIGGSGENQPPVGSHWQTLSYIVLHFALIEILKYNSRNTDMNNKNATKRILLNILICL